MDLQNIKIGGLLSKTDYSETYRATAEYRGEIKQIVVKKEKNTNSAQSFNREIEALEKNNSDHIVKMLGYDRKKKEIYLEFISGTSVDKEIEENGRLNFERALNITSKVCDTLAYLHSKNDSKASFVHYDISDRNILLDGEDSPIMIDFGTAYDLENIPKSHYEALIGTPRFLSPEKFDCNPEHGIKSDVYSMGILAYKMISGTEPFLEFIGNLKNQILNDEPMPLKSRNKTIDDTIMSCLSKNPNNRPSSSEMSRIFKEFRS